MESRVAVLEQIARSTAATLERLEHRFDTVDRRFESMAAEHRTEFRWLPGVMLGGFTTILGVLGAMLAVMAHGVRWL